LERRRLILETFGLSFINFFNCPLVDYRFSGLNEWIASGGCDTAVIFPVGSHFYVSTVTPFSTPRVFNDEMGKKLWKEEF